MKKKCIICGTEFETKHNKQKCCCTECSKINKTQMTRKYNKKHYENNIEYHQCRSKEYYNKNKERLNKQHREYCKENRDKLNSKNKQYWSIPENKKRRSERSKERYNKNKDKILKRRKEKYQENKDNFNKHRREKYKNSTKDKLSHWSRNAIRRCINSYKDKPTSCILNYTPSQLRQHIEGLWEPWMNWENYGTEWHIDHIKPLDAFNFFNEDGSVNYDVVTEANALINLRPLKSSINLSKGSSWTDEDELKYQERIKRLDK